jgi:hypothetical protein
MSQLDQILDKLSKSEINPDDAKELIVNLFSADEETVPSHIIAEVVEPHMKHCYVDYLETPRMSFHGMREILREYSEIISRA